MHSYSSFWLIICFNANAIRHPKAYPPKHVINIQQQLFQFVLNNINNITYKAKICAGSKCAMSSVNVKQKCFQSLPEGTQVYVC